MHLVMIYNYFIDSMVLKKCFLFYDNKRKLAFFLIQNKMLQFKVPIRGTSSCYYFSYTSMRIRNEISDRTINSYSDERLCCQDVLNSMGDKLKAMLFYK